MKLIYGLVLALTTMLAQAQMQVTVHTYPAEDTNNAFSGQDFFTHLNGDSIVAPYGYPTAQAAVTDACATHNPIRVVVSASSATVESIASLTGGCSGVKVEDERPAIHDVYAWNGTQFVKQGYVPNLSVVATSGSYNDLTNLPAISQVGHSGSYTDLLNAPALSPVATSGSYNDLTNQPVISKAGHTGLYTDLLQVPSINLNSLNTSGDMGQTINAVDAQYAGQKIVFQTTQPSVINSPWHVSTGHTLEFHADVTMNAVGTWSSDTALQCFGATIDASSFPLGVLLNVLPQGIGNFQVHNCNFLSNYNTAFDDTGYSTDVTIQGNFFHNTAAYTQHGATANAPTLRMNFLDNTVAVDSPSGIPGVLMYGATQHSLFAHNHFLNTLHGVELYAGDANSAYPHPTTSVIQSLGLEDNILTQNSCQNMTNTCLWASMADAMIMTGNVANNCGDPCFDMEGSSNFLVSDNIAHGIQSDGAGYFTVFYSSHDGVFVNNTASSTGSYGFALWNNDQAHPEYFTGLDIASNKFICTRSTPCSWLRADSNQDTVIEFNKIQDGTWDSPGYSHNMKIAHNTITNTLAGSSPGILVPIMNNGTNAFVEYNTFINEGTGTGPCFSAGVADFNNVNTVTFTGNRCTGYNSDGYFVNSGGNNGVRFQVILRNNQLGTGTLVQSTSSTAPVSIIRTGNCLPSETNNPCQH